MTEIRKSITRGVGCVSYLNSKPLIEPLLNHPGIHVRFAVPSALG